MTFASAVIIALSAPSMTVAAEFEWPSASELADGQPIEESDPDALAAYFNRTEPVAQLQCFLSAQRVFGPQAAHGLPIELNISINADFRASVQATLIPFVHRTLDSDGEETGTIVYRARDVLTVATRSPLGQMLADAFLSDDPSHATQLGIVANPASLIPANRLIGISLPTNDVLVADQRADGQLMNVVAYPCVRWR